MTVHTAIQQSATWYVSITRCCKQLQLLEKRVWMSDCHRLSEFLEASDQEIHSKITVWGWVFCLLLSNNYLKKINAQPILPCSGNESGLLRSLANPCTECWAKLGGEAHVRSVQTCLHYSSGYFSEPGQAAEVPRLQRCGVLKRGTSVHFFFSSSHPSDLGSQSQFNSICIVLKFSSF